MKRLWVLGIVLAVGPLAGCGSSGTSGGGCVSNNDCPPGNYCGPTGTCNYDCKTDDDCPGGTCNSLGKCTGTGGPDAGVPDIGRDPDIGRADSIPWPDLAPPPDTKPLPDVTPSPDQGVPPDSQPPPDGPFSPDGPLPDLAPAPDLVPAPDTMQPDTQPPLNNDLCATPEPLVLVSGLATATGDTATATNGINLPSSGCTGFTTPGPDRFYTVNLSGGKLYEVTLTPSASFDPALYLITDCSDPSGTCNSGMGSDRLGNGVNESILLAPQVSSAYIIVVDSYSSVQMGSYTLTVKEFTPPVAHSQCAAAQQLSFSQGSASASGNTHAATNTVDLPASGCTGYTTPGPDLFYSVYLTAGKAYRVTLKPALDFDPALVVATNCSNVGGTCEPGMGSDQIGNGVSEVVTLAPAASGIHYLMVDSYSLAAKGSFLLTVTEITMPVANNQCPAAQHLTLKSGYASAVGDTRTGTNAVTLSSSGCTGFSTGGPDLFYSFDGVAGKQYTVTLKPSSTFDASLYVFSDCANPEGTCPTGLGSDNIGDGLQEQVAITVTGSGKVYVGVDSYISSEAGTFDLVIREVGVQPCGPANCSGCCWNNTCFIGTQDNACGSGGAACQSCGPGTTCSLGQCVFDLSATWRVVAFSASILSTDPNGQPWDSSAAYANPDPYIKMQIASLTNNTAVLQDTLYPVWNQALFDATANAILSSLYVEIWDSDFLFDEQIGNCYPAVTQADLFLGSKTVTCGRSAVTLMFYTL